MTGDIEYGVDFYWKRTPSWQWDGQERWWEVFVRFTGENGGSGMWIVERWRWNGSPQWMFDQPRSLSFEQTRDVMQAVDANGWVRA